MDKIPNLDELLNYGEEYKYPDLIMSDYFRIDNTRKKDNIQKKQQPQEHSTEQQSEEQTQEQSSDQQNDEQLQEESLEQQQSEEQSQEENLEQQQSEEQFQEESLEQQQSEEQSQEENLEQQQIEEQSQEESLEQQQSEEQSQEENLEQQQSDEQTQEENLEQQQSEEQSQEESSEQQQSDEQTQEQSSEQQQSDEQTQEESLEQQSEEQSQEQSVEQENDENNFDDLLDNYEEDINREHNNNENKETSNPSDKLSDITTTKIYRVLKKLVSLSYERYQKGTYKYDKKEIVKHYLTNQKFKIIDDLVSPTFKPDVYVFDLSPSNNESLEMYVNAISSVAIKNSLIYLTYNDCILRKLLIKKESSKGIDVNKIANSQIKKYNNFDCTIFNEYRSLYEELREIKDRKIYIFSDFDISSDISKLSQENQEIVWFSTERSNYSSSIYQNFFYREYPTSYIGYYVDVSGIEDIEKYIMEKNKNKYKRRSM